MILIIICLEVLRDTVIIRFNWLKATKNLTDSQYREFINKTAIYGFSECADDVTSDDEVVNALLDIVKPSVQQAVYKYLNSTY